MKPYGLIADIHAHSWSAFSGVNDEGTNTRLVGLIAEIERCAVQVWSEGGDTIVLAGDIFHVRGSIAPSVLNPVQDAIHNLVHGGIRVIVLAGNHDLEGKSATRLGSAVTSLEGCGCIVINQPYFMAENNLCLIPWNESVEALKADIDKMWDLNDCVGCDLIIHAPIDGVIGGLPDHGLTAEYLSDTGFRRVFAGHYHHHKDFGNGVYSIGALAHHTWSDVKSKAGFLIVGDEVKWFKSHLPEFVDITGDMDESEASLMAEGNYVRAKVTSAKLAEVEALRKMFMDAGAKGVVIQTVKTPVAARSGGIAATVSAGASLEVSISNYVTAQSFPDAARVAIECQKVLAEAGV